MKGERVARKYDAVFRKYYFDNPGVTQAELGRIIFASGELDYKSADTLRNFIRSWQILTNNGSIEMPKKVREITVKDIIIDNPRGKETPIQYFDRLVDISKAIGMPMKRDSFKTRYYLMDELDKKRELYKDNPATKKLLIYDIETSRATFKAFWTGKQYVGHNQMTQEPKIISISWKWLGEDKVYDLTWDKNHCDKKMVEKFMKVYNSADLVIGINNDNFDNRWVQARAAKFNIEVNNFVRSLDLQKECKRKFRIPSYSMKYLAKYFELTLKQSHEGILMWEMCEDGTPDQQKEYLGKMVEYNRGDIITTEDIYLRLRKYITTKIHLGVSQGDSKFSCPECGSEHSIELMSTTVTPKGTIQRIMKCKNDEVQFKITNKQYIASLKIVENLVEKV